MGILTLIVVLHAHAQTPVDQKRQAETWLRSGGVRFLENRGQVLDTRGELRPEIRYTAGAGNVRIYLSATTVSYVFERIVIENDHDDAEHHPFAHDHESSAEITLYRMDVELIGANPAPEIIAEQPTDDYVNYYLGERAITGLRGHRTLIYRDVYPKIDMVLHATERGMKSEFVVRPGGRVADIRLRYVAADELRLLDDGGLKATTSAGWVEEDAPYTFWTNDAGAEQLVPSRYIIEGDVVRFDVAAYDSTRVLVVDPTRHWATYYGGSSDESSSGGGDITIDASGSVLITGQTFSTNFPTTTGAQQTTNNGNRDAYIVKFDTKGTRKWATYYGGNAWELAHGIATDANKNVIASGHTESTNFPTTTGAYQTNNAGGRDCFILKLDSAGARQWATYYGSTGTDDAYGVTVDGSGNVVATGSTSSTAFPVSTGSFQTTNAGGLYEGFVLKLNSAGARQWATYYGGNSTDFGYAVKTDANRNIFLTGWSNSTNFPVSTGAHQTALSGGYDAVIVKLDSAGARQWATYYGGTASENNVGNLYDADLALDASGNVYITGWTNSTNFPTTTGGYQTTNGGGYDAFIVKLNNSGVRQWATYYGGGNNDHGCGLAIDADKNVWMSGYTVSTNFPVTNPTYQSTRGGGYDAFIVKLDSAGSRKWASYYGGTDDDEGGGIATGGSLNIAITGTTYSTDFPTTTGAYQTNCGGCSANSDVFAVRFCGIDITPTVTASGPITFCQGGSVTLTAPSGYATYTWSTGATTESITVNQSGSYVVTVAEADGCFGRSDTVKVRVNPPPIVTAGADMWICRGSFTVLGGVPTALGSATPFTYSWTPTTGLSAPDIANPAASPTSTTTYVLTVTDTNGCVVRDTVVVTVNNLPTASAGNDATICPGASVVLGGVPAGSGGAPPYTYSWSPAATLLAPIGANPTARPLVTTSYILTVTDANGCVGRDTVVVTVRPQPVVDAGADVEICIGGNTTLGGSPTASGPGAPYSYAWTPATGLSATNIPNPVAGPVTTTTYVVAVTDANGCIKRDTVVVSVNALPTVSAGSDKSVCPGDGVMIGGAPTASGTSGPYTYSWSPATGLNSTTSSNPTASPTAATTYIVTVTDGKGCIARDTVAVTVNTPPIAHAGTDATICVGEEVTLGGTPAGTSGLPPYTYSWSPASGLSSSTAANPTASPTVTTSYILTVTDANGCRGRDTVVITVNTPPTADAGPAISVCIGDGTTIGGSPTASSGSAPYTYSWIPAAGLSGTTIANPTATPTVTTTYVVTVTDANGCMTKDSVRVQVNDRPLVSAGGDAEICFGQSVIIGGSPTATGGRPPYFYSWSPNKGLSSTLIANPTASPTTPTVYIVTVTDANGCVAYDTMIVDINPLPIADAGRDTSICSGAVARLGGAPAATGGTGPYTYFWAPETGLSSRTDPNPAARPLVMTTYILSVTDARGCTSYDTVIVRTTPLAPPPITASGPLDICEGDSVTLIAPAGFALYGWSTGATTQTLTVKKSGTYSVIVTSVDGCSGSPQPIVVTVSPKPKPLIVGPSTVCANTLVSYSIANPINGTYNWTVSSTGTITRGQGTGTIMVRWGASGTGTIGLTVVTNGSGCTGSASLNVTIADRLTPTIAAIGPTTLCDGETVMLDAGAGYSSYQWSDGSAGQSILVQSAGIYLVTVTDANGCTGTSEPITITVRPKPFVQITPSRAPTFCQGDSVTLDAGAGFGSYRWSTGDTTRSIIVKSSGTFTVEITDTSGCKATSAPMRVRVGARPTVAIAVSGKTEFCEGDSVVLSAPPGQPLYRWSNGATTQQIVVRDSGSYSVTVTSTDGCSASDGPVVVTVYPQPRPTISGPSSSCFNSTVTYSVPGSAGRSYTWRVSPGGTIVTGQGTNAITVRWSGVVGTQQVGLTETVTTTGCTADADDIFVEVNSTLSPRITASGATTLCQGDSVVLDAGPGYSSYLWSSGERSQSIVVRQAGTYNVTVTDVAGCSGPSNSVTVTVSSSPRPLPVIRPEGPTTLCEGDSVTLDAGDGYSSYAWSNGATTQRITVKKSGTFSVICTNKDGCAGESGAIAVAVRPKPTALILSLGPTTLCEGDSVMLDAGEGFAGYAWTTGEDTRFITVKRGGTYSVTVVDSVGCEGMATPIAVTVNTRPVPWIASDGPIEFDDGGSVKLSTTEPYFLYRWSNGASGSEITVTESGTYTVSCLDSNGCVGVSGPITITVLPRIASAAVMLPVMEAVPGDRITVPISLVNSQNLDFIGATDFTITVRFNRHLLRPVGATPLGVEDGRDRVITFNGKRANGITTGAFSQLEFIAALGDTTMTPLLIESFAWNESRVSVSTQDGAVLIKPQGGWRAYIATGELMLHPLSPNPTGGMTLIQYETIEPGRTRLFLVDVIGREVGTIFDADLQPGQHTATFDARNLASGTYYCILQTPTSRLVQPLQVGK